jgi:hypothetical protein
VVDDLPLSPELVLVSPPELAARARAALAEPDPPVKAPDRLSRGEVAAAYAVSLAVTLAPLSLIIISLPTRT